MEFIDLKAQYKYLKEKIDKRIAGVLENTHFILGNEVIEFEQQLAEYLGVKHVVSCSDGTAALQLAYMAYGIGAGDAVFCPDMTFIASIEPASMLGATPVFCDIDEKTYNISPISLESRILQVLEEGILRPKAIVAVDFVGNPADYEEIQRIASAYKLLLIEDAAQGIGASYKGRKCGTFGDIATTSFFPSKPLGAYGDGGAVMTNDDAIAALLKSLRVHGKGSSKYDNVRIGLNSRLDTIQAAILSVKLEELPFEMKKRQMIAKTYDEAFQGRIKTPFVREGNISSYAQYILMAESNEKRTIILDTLKEYQIPSLLYYPNPMHRLPVFQEQCKKDKEKFPCTDEYSECSFGIPFSPYLKEEDQKSVIEAVLKGVGWK